MNLLLHIHRVWFKHHCSSSSMGVSRIEAFHGRRYSQSHQWPHTAITRCNWVRGQNRQTTWMKGILRLFRTIIPTNASTLTTSHFLCTNTTLRKGDYVIVMAPTFSRNAPRHDLRLCRCYGRSAAHLSWQWNRRVIGERMEHFYCSPYINHAKPHARRRPSNFSSTICTVNWEYK